MQFLKNSQNIIFKVFKKFNKRNFKYCNGSIFGRIFYFFCMPHNFSFISCHSHTLKQKLTVSTHTHIVRYAGTVHLKLYSGRQICAYQKAKANHVCLQLPRTHSNWTWIVLCSSVPLSPKKARECNYIKIYEITRITLFDGRQKLLYNLLFLQKQFFSFGEHVHE